MVTGTQITRVYPVSGPLAGGTVVTIYGSALGNGSDVINVTLAGVIVRSIVSQAFSQCVVISDTATSAHTGVVAVTSATYDQASGSSFEYNPGMRVQWLVVFDVRCSWCSYRPRAKQWTQHRR